MVDEDWSVPSGAVPEVMEILEPGLELGAMLEAVGPRVGLSGSDLVMVAAARARQLSRLNAQLMADLVAIADRCDPRVVTPPLGLKGRPIDYGVERSPPG